MNKKVCKLLIALSVVLMGCGKEKIEYFDTTIFKIEVDNFEVDCPIDDGPGNDVGYFCSIEFNNETILKDTQGNDLQYEDFKIGDSVRVVLPKPKVLREKDINLDVREIQLLVVANN